ncbi:MAG: DinB family protein, partial [Solimonas sp.]
MISVDYCRLFSAYNGWMNERLYAAAASLSDAERKADRGAYFKSIHSTFNHLLYGDTAWLYRFTARSLDGLRPDASRYDDFAALRGRRAELDAELRIWAETVTPEWLAADFNYYSQVYRTSYVRPAWTLVAHLFNHQTHHRGQITTLLSQAGID